MPKITIDGQQYQVEEEQNLLEVCLSEGINLPYFCWHPAMGSVGACRQCAVIEYRDTEDQSGRLVMGCMTPVKDGGIYSVNAEAARDFRGGIIEDLMINHPHDCPVCEEGGECHLQDMTEMSGHTSRRYHGEKRTHRNQYLGPFINHEMNRCIACYRCVRFYRDYAGGDDLEVLGRNNQVYFGRQQDGMLENGFSGNLVEVCPTGVFTDKTFSKHFVRKWDLQTAPSVCEHCAVGCNTAPGAREGWDGKEQMLRRVVNLYHQDINGYFICDRGRFGYDYVNSDVRLKQVLVAGEDRLIGSTASSEGFVHKELSPELAVEKFAKTVDDVGAGERRLIGIGSPRSSLENNFALCQLVGKENFYAGLSELDFKLLHLVDDLQRDERLRSPTTPQIENADAVLVLGEDISNTAPRIALAVRQAARNRQKRQAQQLKIPLWQDASVRQLIGKPSPIFIAAMENTGLDDIACGLFQGPTDDIARFGLLVAKILKGQELPDDFPQQQLQQAHQLAEILRDAESPLVVSGCGGRSQSLLEAAGSIAAALSDHREGTCDLYLACPEVNSLGLAQLCQPENNLQSLLQKLQQDRDSSVPVSLVILENDLYRRLHKEDVNALFDSVEESILLDHLHNRTSRRAQLIFPAAATPESQGTVISSNGLAQRFYAVYEGAGFIQESWRWLVDAAGISTGDDTKLEPMRKWQHCTDIGKAIAAEFPELRVVAELGPDADFRIDGLKIARQSHRYSGRTAIRADRSVAETKPHSDPDAPLSYSMEGVHNPNRSALQANIWHPGWNSNQALHKFQQRVGAARRSGNGGKPIERSAQTFMPDQDMPAAWSAPTDGYQLLPLYRLFGSGELSASAPALATAIPEPFALLNKEDAHKLQVNDGDEVMLRLGPCEQRLSVHISPAIMPGSLGVPVGFPQLDDITTSSRGQLQRVTNDIALETGEES